MTTNDDSITVDQLRAFMAAVDATRQKDAASVVGVAQSTFNHHLRRAEAYFGGGLFLPGPGMRLTARGQLVAQGVSKTLIELSSTRALSRERILRIGFIRIARPMVERVLRDLYRARGETFDVQLVELPSETQMRLMDAQELDVAICYARARHFLSSTTIEHCPVAEQPYCLVLPEHAWKRNRVVKKALAALHYTHVPRTFSPEVFDLGRRWLGAHELVPRRQIECALATEIIAYAGAGRGFGFLPALWSTTNRDGVVFAPTDDFNTTSEVSVFFQGELRDLLNPFLTRLAATAQDLLQAYQPPASNAPRAKRAPTSRAAHG